MSPKEKNETGDDFPAVRPIALFEGKPADSSVINPEDWRATVTKLRGPPPELPPYGILSFRYMKLFDFIEKEYEGSELDFFGKDVPLQLFSFQGMDAVLALIPVGAAAAGMIMEDLIGLGLKTIILVGGVGVVAPNIPRGRLLLPSKAIRDEGTSFHYQEPSRYAHPSKKVSQALRQTLGEANCEFVEGLSWTTDAPYRETHEKIRNYLTEGVVSVEMEALALFAIGTHRNIDIGALFIAEDYVGGKTWQDRREKGDRNEIKNQRQAALRPAIHALWNLAQTEE
ncbi:MAG: nucleoside phosphorylase [Candidatus Heimdallarchaeota archaeon]